MRQTANDRHGSLIYEIQTLDVYEDFFTNINFRDDHFDFSGFKNAPDALKKFYLELNNKVVGMMKDETNGVAIREFLGLKAKMYAYLLENLKEAMRAKGIQKAVVDRELNFERYKQQFQHPEENLLVNRRFQSDCHVLSTISQEKRGLSAFDDKRFILADNVHTLAYGHHKLRDRMTIVDVPEAMEDFDVVSDAELLREGMIVQDVYEQLGDEYFDILYGL